MKKTLDPTSHTPPPIEDVPLVTLPEVAYIGSSVEFGFLVGDRALPREVDDAERDFGLDLYDRMANDSMLGGAEAYLKIMALADGLSVVPSVEEPKGRNVTPQQEADYKKATDISDFVKACIDRLGRADRPILDILWDMLDAMRKGHCLAEVTYEIAKSGDLAGKMVITSIRPKPRQNYAFVLDSYNNFRGVIAVVPGVSIALRRGIVFGLDQMANAIAPSKLLILTMGSADGNPQGRSWFRRAYDPWYRKQLMKPEAVKTGIQFGGGMITAVAPDENQQTQVTDPVSGQQVRLSQAIQTALTQLSNGGIATFPAGTTLTVHRPAAECKYFEDFFNRCDQEMITTFLLSGRAMLEAKHGSKADSDTSQDVVDELKTFVRQKLCDMLTLRLFRPLVELNYPADIAQKFCPIAVMKQASRPDFAANATGIAALMTSKYIDASQMPGIDREILGFPERQPEEDAGDEPAGFQPPIAGGDLQQDPDGSSLPEVDERRAGKAAQARARAGSGAPIAGAVGRRVRQAAS